MTFDDDDDDDDDDVGGDEMFLQNKQLTNEKR